MRHIRLGMIGGGEGALIGNVHRIAARLDDRFSLDAGVFSSDPDRSNAFASTLGLRGYGSVDAFISGEIARDDGVEAVSIVTPNHLHADAAIKCLDAGLHVICDKPLSATSEQAGRIAQAVKNSSAKFFLTHNYTGYPMVRLARDLVARGELGALRLIVVNYVQDWLAKPIETQGHKQAAWRTNPAQSGAGVIGDIGTHAYNLACFVTGQHAQKVSAELHTFVKGRAVDDNAFVHLRYQSGLRGSIWVSQVVIGSKNDLSLKLVGDRATIEWGQENPNELRFSIIDKPTQVIARGEMGSDVWGRTPPGHPEGFIEAFANVYSDVADCLDCSQINNNVPTIADGLEGMSFIQACKDSENSNGDWISPKPIE
jgi:predicted dehydrogenase